MEDFIYRRIPVIACWLFIAGIVVIVVGFNLGWLLMLAGFLIYFIRHIKLNIESDRILEEYHKNKMCQKVE